MTAHAAPRVLIGTSGYDYPHWRGTFYPAGLPRGDWLRHAAAAFDTIELNGTFYSLKSPEVFRRWAAEVPDDFVFAVKGSRYVTHMLKLRSPRAGLANFFASGVLALGRHTGPFLWQLPPGLRFDAPRVGAFLEALPRTSDEAARLARRHDRRLPARALLRAAAPLAYRHALEPRDASFDTPACHELLARFGVALVVADSGGRFPTLDRPTANFAYVRFHGPGDLYGSGYGAARLAPWAERLRAWTRNGRAAYVYFNNDSGGHAPRDAAILRRLLSRPDESAAASR